MTISNRYNLIKRLGEGGFGEVWLAEDQTSNRQVALKLYKITGSGHDELVREFNQVYGLDSVNLVKAYHVDRDEAQGISYLVMDYCRYGSLVQTVGRMGESEMWRCIRDIASGLMTLSEHTVYDEKQQREIAAPVVHQDLKPANILIRKLDKDGHNVYAIADFGISKTMVSQKSGSSVFVSAGTLAYMGPERFYPNYRPRVESDIWSLGAMLYELWDGKTHFPSMDSLSAGNWLNQEGVTLPAIEKTIPFDLSDLIYSCMAKDPEKRPTAKQLYETANAKLSAFGKDFHDDTFTQPAKPLNNEKLGVNRGRQSDDNQNKPKFSNPFKIWLSTHGFRCGLFSRIIFFLSSFILVIDVAFVRSPAVFGFSAACFIITLIILIVTSLTDRLSIRKFGNDIILTVDGSKYRMNIVHKTDISGQYFYMGETQVTQIMWYDIMENNPSKFNHELQSIMPVDGMNWYDCQEFIKKLNKKLKKDLRSEYYFALPNEADWEFAARGGKNCRTSITLSGTLDDIAWYSGNSDAKTHPVAQKKANELGLFDMCGNVWEWCGERYDVTGGDTYCVLRGGSYNNSNCNPSSRTTSAPYDRYCNYGLRLALYHR